MLAENDEDLYSCNTDTLLTVLNVIHHNGYSVPKKVDFEELLDIAQLSEEYGHYRVLYLWAKLWMEKLKDLALREGYEDWIFIA